ncbi:MAG: PulJ/GspJ family protein [Candidatus Dormibacteraceae bacterium]
MRTRHASHFPSPALRAKRRAGFTLAEALIASTLFLLLLGGIVGANLFGLRMSQLTQVKLTRSDAARQLVGRMTDEIRSCKTVYIGSVSNGVFSAVLDGSREAGTALIIYPTTNTANYILYFLNAADESFRRTTSSQGTAGILVQPVTNAEVFSAQDCLGNVITNSQNNRVIHFDLEVFQPQPYLPTPDYFKLESSITKRALE